MARPARPQPVTVTVDPVYLITVLHALSAFAPSTFHPGVANAAVGLEASVAEFLPESGIFDLGWGLRATDQS